MEIAEVILRWQVRAGPQQIPSGTGLSRNTVRKCVASAKVTEIAKDGPPAARRGAVEPLLQGEAAGRLRALGRNSETPVESRQELPQHVLGLLHLGCSPEPKFRDQPVLKCSSRPTHTSLGLRRQGENQLCTQLSIVRPNCVGVPAG